MLILFMSQPDFACNPHALWKYVVENTDYETAWIIKRGAYFKELTERGIKCAVYDSYESLELIDSADIIVANTYTFLNIPKKDNQLLVNLWHGSGVKAHDYYDHNLNPRHAIKLKNYFDKMDLMCVHSLDDRFKLSAMLHFDLRKMYVTGQPRLDYVTTSNGKEKLEQLLGDVINQFDHLIFFAPSYRSNMSSHAGTIYSDNIFRLPDFESNRLNAFLEKHNAAIVYKLHPIEQTAFSGRNFEMGDRCFELTDRELFFHDIRYGELLNAFDVMVSDYSSIAFDYLLLDRPIVYLLPDFDEYKNAKGFVFSNIDDFMPGEKVGRFEGLLDALENAIYNPNAYADARQNVINYRFDYVDGKSTERCFNQIMNFKKISDEYTVYQSDPETIMPSTADQISRYIDKQSCLVIDSRKNYEDRDALLKEIEKAEKVYYVTGEIPGRFRSVSVRNSYKIEDMGLYNSLLGNPKVNIAYIRGGVDYNMFSSAVYRGEKRKPRIGFAGTIDNRIYFSMVQCICEAFPECEVVFAGTIVGDYPAWLSGFDNLTYIEMPYGKLPETIASFDVAILPFFGGHKKQVPSELFQYLACGKCVVASDMPKLPECSAIYRGASITEVIDNIRLVLSSGVDSETIENAKMTAKEFDWKVIAENLRNDVYNYCADT